MVTSRTSPCQTERIGGSAKSRSDWLVPPESPIRLKVPPTGVVSSPTFDAHRQSIRFVFERRVTLESEHDRLARSSRLSSSFRNGAIRWNSQEPRRGKLALPELALRDNDSRKDGSDEHNWLMASAVSNDRLAAKCPKFFGPRNQDKDFPWLCYLVSQQHLSDRRSGRTTNQPETR